MGPLFAVVAVCMVAVATCSAPSQAPGYGDRGPGPHGNQYGHHGYMPRRNLYSELSAAKARVNILAGGDARLNAALDDVMLKINSATDFREEFLNEIYPHLQQSMKMQGERIAGLTATLKDQFAIIDDVNQLSAKVDTLLANVHAARDNHQRIIGDLIGLTNREREQRIAISNITAEAAIQNIRLDEAEGKIEDNEEAGQRIYNKLIEVVNVVNNDRAEVFYIEVDNSANVDITFSTPFTTKVYFNYAIKGYHAEETYQESYGSHGHNSERIVQSLTIDGNGDDGNTYGATIAASTEENLGWGPVKYVACVLAYFIDNTIIETI